jgi:ferredoxin
VSTTLSEQETTASININKKALDRLTWAKKKDEDYSDVIIRLSSTKLDGLQRRGEKEIIALDRRLILKIDQDRCMGAESCVLLAPDVFALDEKRLGFTPESTDPLGIRDVMDRSIESDTILRAARSCPYKAISVVDADTGEELCP